MTLPPPDDVPRSPSGRVPKWVMDEAAGRPVEAVPFRAPTTSVLGGPPATAPRPRRSRRSRVTPWIAVLIILAGATGLAWLQRQPTHRNAAAGAPPGVEESADRLLPAPPAVSGGRASSHAFTRSHDDGTPVTWSPCRPIHYVIRPAHAPKGGAALLASAIDEVSAATGLAFVADGTTDEAASFDRQAYQPDRYGERWAPVLIAWVTQKEVPEFTSDIAGMAGPVAWTNADGDQALVSGAVMLDPTSITAARAAGGKALARAVMLHELGHLVGLAHVKDRTQLMYPESGGTTRWGRGDLAGLAVLGSGPCQPRL